MQSKALLSSSWVPRRPPPFQTFGFASDAVASPSVQKGDSSKDDSKNVSEVKVEKVVTKECGDLADDDDGEMEQEEMFVEAHESFEHRMMEWGGPRRGGRLPEPTRYGDWERKGRCSDF